MLNEPLLEVRNLKKYFPVTRGLVLRKTIGWLKAVDDVTLDIGRGETLGLVGESGCGKTTTARLILRLQDVTEGVIFFDGQDVTHARGTTLRSFRKAVQAVFQDPWSSLNPRLRIGDTITEPMVVSGSYSRSAARSRAAELLEMVGLRPDQATLFPHQFSGGQRQRIAVARALSVSPKLIVLDEPVSALDVSIRAQILNLLRDLQAQQGLSYMLIAHDLAPVRYMSERIGVMYLGKLVEIGPGHAVLSKPLHPYTQALYAAAASEVGVSPLPSTMGELPSPINLPSGCRFRSRCPAAMPVCAEVEPELKEVAPGHRVACHLY